MLMKHSTPWRDVLEANVASVISGNSRRARRNGEEAWTTLTPEISLEVAEKRVEVLE